jgi:adenylate cyclase
VGDAIMAFWNAPLGDEAHADHAALSMLTLARELTRLNDQWRISGADGRRVAPRRQISGKRFFVMASTSRDAPRL